MAGILPKFNKKGPNTVGQRTNDDLWTRTGTFINKPVHGWLHPEEKLKHGGICYGVRYVGCLEVKQSTRTLPFEVRGQVTKGTVSSMTQCVTVITLDNFYKLTGLYVDAPGNYKVDELKNDVNKTEY